MDIVNSNENVFQGIFEGYTTSPNVYDELLDENLHPRSHWEYLVKSLSTLGTRELSNRERDINRMLRESGINFQSLTLPQETNNLWSLDIIPSLITSREWNDIEMGLSQRAELLSHLLVDLYGQRSVIQNQIVPPEAVYASSAYLRPCQINRTLNRHRLTFYAADLIRKADGSVWVLNDITQSPQGLGYVLKNRIVLSRIFPSIFRDSHVHRLANYFRSLRSALQNLTTGIDLSSVVMLIPGYQDDSYSELLFLARYLGIPTVQGGDLTLRDRQVLLKTLDGLQPVQAIFRQISDYDSDPLHLNPNSMVGVPGLVQAARLGRTMIANPLGSGILENPALVPFLPALCKHFLGEELRLPTVNTWWCGQEQERTYVKENIENLVIKPVDPRSTQPTLIGKQLSSEERDALVKQIETFPYQFAAQEYVEPSTSPVFSEGVFSAKPIVLRSFLVTQQDGYAVMPGGLTRVLDSQENVYVKHLASGVHKDSWLLASEPEIAIELQPQPQPSLEIRRSSMGVSSRVAENTFWFGRYAERTESNARLMREFVIQLLDTESYESIDYLPFLIKALAHQTGNPQLLEETKNNPESELLQFIFNSAQIGGLPFNISALSNTAQTIRDRLSDDAMRFISELNLPHESNRTLTNALIRLEDVVFITSGIAGLMAESMSRGQGYLFLDAGKRIERALNTIMLINSIFANDKIVSPKLCEVVLSITDSSITFRRRYPTQMHPMLIVDLLIFDENNPRSVGYQLVKLKSRIKHFPEVGDHNRFTPEEKIIMLTLTQLRTTVLDSAPLSSHVFPAELSKLLQSLENNLNSLSDSISHRYFNLIEKPHQMIDIA